MDVLQQQQGVGDEAFTNVNATHEECLQRQARFFTFLKEYLVYDAPEAENTSQASAVSSRSI